MNAFLSFCQVLDRPRSTDNAVARTGLNSIFDRNVMGLIHQFLSPQARFRAWEKTLPPPLNGMDEFLKANRAVLTGSTAVHFFFPDDGWHPDDIDIFFPEGDIYNHFRHAHDLLEKQGWSEIVTKGRLRFEGAQDDYNIVDLPVKSTTKFKHTSGHVLNMTACKSDEYTGPCHTQNDVKRLTHQYFDLDGCTLSWDGDKWELAPRITWKDFYHRRWRLRTRDYGLLPKRVSDVATKRVAKYRARGFNISDTTQIEFFLNLRKRKYPEEAEAI